MLTRLHTPECESCGRQIVACKRYLDHIRGEDWLGWEAKQTLGEEGRVRGMVFPSLKYKVSEMVFPAFSERFDTRKSQL